MQWADIQVGHALLLAGLALSLAGRPSLAEDVEADSPDSPSAQVVIVNEDGEGSAKAEGSGESGADAPPPITLPIPVGQEVKGIKIPYFDVEGAKKMDFYAEQARRVDEDHVRMSNVRIQMYDDMGGPDLDFHLPVSVFQVADQLLSSDKPVVIRRKDFRITGQNMVFNLNSRKGRLGGEVNMVIYDRSNLN